MTILNSLISWIKKNPDSTTEPPEGLCPNCWGRNEYGGQFYKAVKNNHSDINSKNPNVGWVQDYADKHLTPIRLQKQGLGEVCPKCKVSYKTV